MTNLGGTVSLFGTIAILLVASAGGGIAAGTAASLGGNHADRQLDVSQVEVVQNDSEDANTVRHIHPDEYDEDGDLESVERWLIDQMAGDLEEGAIQLSDGEFDRAGQYLDEVSHEQLEQYAEIADETDGESHEELFASLLENQEKMTTAVQQYHETRDEYEENRTEGNEEQARELARELDALAETVADSSRQLHEDSDALETDTDVNLSEHDGAIGDVNEEIQRDRDEIRENEFLQTAVTIEPEEAEISFLDPLVADGQLRTIDGEPITNESIQLQIGNGTVRTETDSDGTFNLEYRPTEEPISADQLKIRYIPDDESVFLGAETAIDISIEQVEPAVSNLETSDEIAYDDEVNVEGALHADDVPVDGVPLAILLEDERIGTANVSDGSIGGSGEVPASPADGERELSIQLVFGSEADEIGEERALAATTATTDVTVHETESSLSISARHTEGTQDQTAEVNGTLETINSAGVGGETIQIRADGTTLESATTSDDGSFNAVVDVPESSADGDVRIVAAYDGSESNLKSAQADSIITYPSETDARSLWAFPAWMWLGSGLLVVFAFGAAVRWYQSRDRRSPESVPETPLEANGRDSGSDRESDPSRELVTRRLLDCASEQLSNGRPNEAVSTAYAAVRHALSARVDASDALTHWEFYRHCLEHDRLEIERHFTETDGGMSDADGSGRTGERDGEATGAVDGDPLRTVTERYERATYDTVGVASDEAKGALERARRLCAQARTCGSSANDGSSPEK